MSGPTTPVVRPELVALLRADLTSAGFTLDGIAERLGPVASAALHREQSLPALLVTEGADDPCAVLVRLLTLGRPVRSAALAAALPSLGLDGARALRLVVDAPGGDVSATCDLRPYADDAHEWWVASDLSDVAAGQTLRADHVLGIGGASTTLSSWTVRRPVARALDLGTGSGVQTLHLASHCTSIVATDISERALGYAAFTAALAGLELDLRQGDLLDPVAAETFSLVVSNPPFVITPRDAV